MERTILITNDDGIRSPGIIRLAEAAKKYGTVWVIAPHSQRSAESHRITLHKPIDIHPVPDFGVEGVNAFSCNGSPADCVRLGEMRLLPHKSDAVLSGINYGYNIATDIQYSATVGAAFEGTMHGVLSIAFSEHDCEIHEVADAWLDPVLEKLLNSPVPENRIYNVNFPGCPLSECKGVLYDRTMSKAIPFDDHYDKVEEFEDGGASYLVRGIYRERGEAGSDFRAVTDNYVSVGTVSNIC